MRTVAEIEHYFICMASDDPKHANNFPDTLAGKLDWFKANEIELQEYAILTNQEYTVFVSNFIREADYLQHNIQ